MPNQALQRTAGAALVLLEYNASPAPAAAELGRSAAEGFRVGKRAKREQRHAERREVAAAREAERRAQSLAEVAAQRCPACGAAEVARIGYGLPRFTPELTADLDAGRVVLGGCDISGDDPVWLCRACKHSWGRLFPPPAPEAEPGAAADGGGAIAFPGS